MFLSKFELPKNFSSLNPFRVVYSLRIYREENGLREILEGLGVVWVFRVGRNIILGEFLKCKIYKS